MLETSAKNNHQRVSMPLLVGTSFCFARVYDTNHEKKAWQPQPLLLLNSYGGKHLLGIRVTFRFLKSALLRGGHHK